MARVLRVRPVAAVTLAALCLVLPGCTGAGGGAPGAAERPVTFRGTATADSMAPTIEAGDRIIARRVPVSGPVAGDVVVYRSPAGWLGPQEGAGKLVHRVIGTPGDTLFCCDADGRLSVNGTPLDEPYVDPGADCDAPVPGAATGPGTSLAGPCDWTIGPVPAGRLFVMGDHREAAADSRFHLCPPDRDPCADSPWLRTDLVVGVVDLRDEKAAAGRLGVALGQRVS